jgi:hypothetical protein
MAVEVEEVLDEVEEVVRDGVTSDGKAAAAAASATATTAATTASAVDRRGSTSSTNNNDARSETGSRLSVATTGTSARRSRSNSLTTDASPTTLSHPQRKNVLNIHVLRNGDFYESPRGDLADSAHPPVSSEVFQAAMHAAMDFERAAAALAAGSASPSLLSPQRRRKSVTMRDGDSTPVSPATVRPLISCCLYVLHYDQ